MSVANVLFRHLALVCECAVQQTNRTTPDTTSTQVSWEPPPPLPLPSHNIIMINKSSYSLSPL